MLLIVLHFVNCVKMFAQTLKFIEHYFCQYLKMNVNRDNFWNFVSNNYSVELGVELHNHSDGNFVNTLLGGKMSECDSSDQAVSVVVVGVNLFGFSTSSLEPLHRFASNFVWMFLG